MRKLTRSAAVLGMIGLGYVLGASDLLRPGSANAQAAAEGQPPKASAGAALQLSDEALAKVQTANDAVKSSLAAIQAEKRYTPAMNAVNSFASTVGGFDAMADLEAGRGVDPETFAALYAGLATDAVAQELGEDEDGRLTYKGKVVRMYPVSRLRSLFAAREQIMQVE